MLHVDSSFRAASSVRARATSRVHLHCARMARSHLPGSYAIGQTALGYVPTMPLHHAPATCTIGYAPSYEVCCKRPCVRNIHRIRKEIQGKIQIYRENPRFARYPKICNKRKIQKHINSLWISPHQRIRNLATGPSFPRNWPRKVASSKNGV